MFSPSITYSLPMIALTKSALALRVASQIAPAVSTVSSQIVPEVATELLQKSLARSITHFLSSFNIIAPYYFFLNHFNGFALSARFSTFSLTYHPITNPKTSPIVKNIIFSLNLYTYIFIVFFPGDLNSIQLLPRLTILADVLL